MELIQSLLSESRQTIKTPAYIVTVDGYDILVNFNNKLFFMISLELSSHSQGQLNDRDNEQLGDEVMFDASYLVAKDDNFSNVVSDESNEVIYTVEVNSYDNNDYGPESSGSYQSWEYPTKVSHWKTPPNSLLQFFKNNSIAFNQNDLDNILMKFGGDFIESVQN